MQNRNINLVYWRNSANFGDALSPWILKKLMDCNICPKDHYSGLINSLKTLLYAILHADLKSIKRILWPWQKNMICVGSVITYGNLNSLVWGSGFMNYSDSLTYLPKSIFCVRGPLTAEKLYSNYNIKCSTYGDPALLLPIFIERGKERHSIGIIPHWKETDIFKKKYGDKYNVIDLRTENIEQVIAEITSCQYTLCTSLHGIIVSHAYGIPSLWLKSERIGCDGFKFSDYFGSVGIPQYEGFSDKDIPEYKELFKNNWQYALPNLDIICIRQNLLKSFPYKISFKFQL